MDQEFRNGLVGQFCLVGLLGVAVRCHLEPFESLTVLRDLFPKWHNHMVGKLGLAVGRWPFYMYIIHIYGIYDIFKIYA